MLLLRKKLHSLRLVRQTDIILIYSNSIDSHILKFHTLPTPGD